MIPPPHAFFSTLTRSPVIRDVSLFVIIMLNARLLSLSWFPFCYHQGNSKLRGLKELRLTDSQQQGAQVRVAQSSPYHAPTTRSLPLLLSDRVSFSGTFLCLSRSESFSLSLSLPRNNASPYSFL